MMKSVHIALFLLIFTGCSSIENRYDPSNVSLTEVSDNSGILLLSAGAPKSCVSTSTYLKVQKVSEDYFSAEQALLGVDAYVFKSDFPSHQGNIHAVILPEGEYYMAPWIANTYVEPKKVPKVNFTINAGEIVYVGEYFMETSCNWSPKTAFNNEYDRDIALLLNKNPELANSKIISRIAKFSGYAVGDE